MEYLREVASTSVAAVADELFLSVFDHFVGWALKGLRRIMKDLKISKILNA